VKIFGSSFAFVQLNYKEKTDTGTAGNIDHSFRCRVPTSFFINKAIVGYYANTGKTHPDWVKEFWRKTPLNNLSKREALRIINKK